MSSRCRSSYRRRFPRWPGPEQRANNGQAAPPRSVPGRCRSDQHWGRAIDVGEQTLQILDLWQIVDGDIRVTGITRQEILMIILGRIEFPAGLDLGDDWSIKHVRLVELGDIGLGNAQLLGILWEDRRAVLSTDIRPLAVELGRKNEDICGTTCLLERA